MLIKCIIKSKFSYFEMRKILGCYNEPSLKMKELWRVRNGLAKLGV
jgi:hypothetical protein